MVRVSICVKYSALQVVEPLGGFPCLVRGCGGHHAASLGPPRSLPGPPHVGPHLGRPGCGYVPMHLRSWLPRGSDHQRHQHRLEEGREDEFQVSASCSGATPTNCLRIWSCRVALPVQPSSSGSAPPRHTVSRHLTLALSASPGTLARRWWLVLGPPVFPRDPDVLIGCSCRRRKVGATKHEAAAGLRPRLRTASLRPASL